MKLHSPYYILLAVTLFFAGFMVLYNFELKNKYYDVAVHYSYPQPPLQARGSPAYSGAGQPRLPDTAEPPYQEIIVEFPLELNSATGQQLTHIPHIGEVTSQRIVQYRDLLGGYTSLEQLMDIKGIGQQTYEQISAYLYLEGDYWDSSDKTEQTESMQGGDIN